MRIWCAPAGLKPAPGSVDLEVVLYSRALDGEGSSIAASLPLAIGRAQLVPDPAAWDFLSLALAVIAADTFVSRAKSPDGWTREINLTVAISNPDLWTQQGALIQQFLRFLTTDLWTITFVEGGQAPPTPRTPAQIDETCVTLLSGGLDSLIGAIDLTAQGHRPMVVSQVAQGDKYRQSMFAASIGGGLRHLQLNHNASAPVSHERSQRARSLAFLAYGVVAATSLKRYHDGQQVPLYVCENGLIAINPPLTARRLGSLSTRTAHPVFLGLVQSLLRNLGIHTEIENPYAFKTKGAMLAGCADQGLLRQHAASTTSCGRFARMGYCHCGRCVPCLIRRAAFSAWGQKDTTTYRYSRLSRKDANHALFDDVRSAAIAVAEIQTIGLERWLGATLASPIIADGTPYREVVRRGMDELARYLSKAGIK